MLNKNMLNFFTYRELRRRLRAFPLSWEDLQIKRLEKTRRFLADCYESFDFYRRRFDAAGFNPRIMRSVEELQVIPPLTKEEYRDFCAEQIGRDPGNYAGWYQDGTSGTSGNPLKILRSPRERAYMLSKYLRALFLNGLRYRDVTFCLPSPHRMNPFDSRLQRFGILRRVCVPYTDSVERMVAGYQGQKVDLLYANRSHLVLMAEYIKLHGIEIVKPRLVCSSGEMMDATSRGLIEDVFGEGRLFEVYGAVEFNNLAFQIVGQQGFHFNHDTNLIELEGESGHIDPKAGRCLITDLHIRSFPLVRYRLDDWIEMEEGDGVPRIKKIVGRSDDWFVLADGTRKPFHSVYEIMERENEVLRFRFIQQAIDRIDVQLTTSPLRDHGTLERRIADALHREFDHAIQFRFQYFDELPPDPHAKMRMVISNIKEGRVS